MRRRAPKQRKIGEYTYLVVPLQTSEALEVERRLRAILFTGVEKLGTQGDITAGLAGLFKALTADDQGYITNLFCENTQIQQGAKVTLLKHDYDEHFAGHLDEWLDWVLFCLDVNFSSFLTGVLSKLKGKGWIKETPLVSSFLSTSLGSSTESPSVAGTTTPLTPS